MRSLLLLLTILSLLVSSVLAGPTSSQVLNQAPSFAQGQSSANEEIQDIYGPLATDHPPLLALGFGLAAILILLVAAIYLFRKKKKIPAPSVSACAQALAELAAVRPLMTDEHALHYMEKVADILRRFIEMRFVAPITTRTTGEFFSALLADQALADRLIEPFRSEIRLCLERCDMAKFAHQPPTHAEMIEIDSAIRNMLEKTDLQQQGQGEQ